jgi:hypothetical protein
MSADADGREKKGPLDRVGHRRLPAESAADEGDCRICVLAYKDRPACMLPGLISASRRRSAAHDASAAARQALAADDPALTCAFCVRSDCSMTARSVLHSLALMVCRFYESDMLVHRRDSRNLPPDLLQAQLKALRVFKLAAGFGFLDEGLELGLLPKVRAAPDISHAGQSWQAR